MRLAAEDSAALRQEVRGEERESESQSSAITIKKGSECLWLVTAFQHFCLKSDVPNIFSLIAESDKASVRGRIGSVVVVS